MCKNEDPGSGINFPDPKHWLKLLRVYDKICTVLLFVCFIFLGKVSEEQSGAALFRTGKPLMTLSTEVSAFAITKAARDIRQKCSLVSGGYHCIKNISVLYTGTIVERYR
jgi:hypothetical protein